MTRPVRKTPQIADTRVRLTLEDAQRGKSPEPFTVHEWHAMHMASAQETRDKHWRLCEEYFQQSYITALQEAMDDE